MSIWDSIKHTTDDVVKKTEDIAAETIEDAAEIAEGIMDNSAIHKDLDNATK